MDTDPHRFISHAGVACARPTLALPGCPALQFVLAAPSPRFAALHRLLPQVFVGSMEQLEHVVEWVTREMQWSFKETGQALPPWREHAAVMSKWRSAAPLPAPGAHPHDSPAGSSPCSSPRAPCCCCCQQGGAAAAAAADAAASGCGGIGQPAAFSPSSVCQPPAAICGGSDRQVSAALTASTPSTPMSVASAVESCQPRISLLSRSLEAAGLHVRMQQQQQRLVAAASWWEPRTITVVRRSA